MTQAELDTQTTISRETLNAFLALGLLLSGGAAIRGIELPGLLTWTGTPITLGRFRTTTGVIVMLLIYLVLAYFLGRTAWGRHVFGPGAPGSRVRPPGWARRCGRPPRRQ